MSTSVLVVNAGSSSLKFSLYGAAPDALLCRGQVAHESGGAMLRASASASASLARPLVAQPFPADADNWPALLLDWVDRAYPAVVLAAAAHRVVHGGPHYHAPVLIDAAVLEALQRLTPLAPLHQPHALAAIAALMASHPALPQVACFDTAFHHTLPRMETSFAVTPALHDEGLRRYGFHGLSYEYIAARLPDLMGAWAARGKIVIAHLGAGASMCALRDGRSIATTMGMTPLDGLPMATRCGAIDPGAVLWLMQEKGLSTSQVADMLYHDSGLLGVSGVSGDMQVLLASRTAAAAQAIDLFVYRIGRELGSLAAAMGGIDALVFTGGIGEHAAAIRQRVCAGAAWLGVRIDAAANAAHGPRLTCIDSPVAAWAVTTDEDAMIMRHTRALLQPARSFSQVPAL